MITNKILLATESKGMKNLKEEVWWSCLFRTTSGPCRYCSIMKSIFISQPYVHREIYHELLYRLCANKQIRSDIINILLLILTEGVIDQHSLEKVYNLICSRVHGSAKAQGSPSTIRLLPADCTPLVVANQAIEILQNLIEADSRLKYFFITEHENLMINKAPVKNRRDIFNKNFEMAYQVSFCPFESEDNNR